MNYLPKVRDQSNESGHAIGQAGIWTQRFLEILSNPCDSVEGLYLICSLKMHDKLPAGCF